MEQRCGSDLAQHANRQAGAWKWMAPEDAMGQSEFFAEHTHLILEPKT